MKLYDEIKWSGYDWYIIGIKDDSYKLLMKETLKNEDYLDQDNEMKFGNSNIWRDSFIRDKLNNEFINNLVKEDMLEMTTRIRDDEEIIEATDYIRLLTINEILDDLPMEIRKCDDWYWSLSPRAYSWASSGVFYLNSTGYVYNGHAMGAGSVRPVVLINKSALEKGNQEHKIPKKLNLDTYAKIGTEVDRDLIIKINEILDYLEEI